MEPRLAPLVVVSGPSGVGKSTVVDAVLVLVPEVWLSVSVTTRPPRVGEIAGQDYYFVADEEFDRLIAQDELLEWAHFAGNRYGTPVILEIEVAGARQVRSRVPEAQLVFLAPPSRPELAARLIGRGTESPEAVAQRLAAADLELAAAPEFDRVIVNTDVGQCAAALVACLHE